MTKTNTYLVAAGLAVSFSANLPAKTASCLSQPNLVCTVVGNIHLYAKNDQRLKELSAPVATAQDLFKTHFAVPVPQGAVLESPNITSKQESALKKTGLRWLLPWLDSADSQAMMQATLRAQLRSEMPKASEQEIDALLKQSIDSLGAASPSPGEKKTNPSALGASLLQESSLQLEGSLQHEIGHVLFIHSFWGGHEGETDGVKGTAMVYGAPEAPDWLDETAAILMENDELTHSRRKSFEDQIQQKGLQSLKPLKEYFAMPHPGLQSPDILKLLEEEENQPAEGKSKSVRTMVTLITDKEITPEQRAHAEQEAEFYSLARVFADFMLEQSRDPHVFGKIASALREKRSMADWLKTPGTQLPFRTIEELEVDWQKWVKEKYLKAPAAAS